jgi:hypothetical protein
MEVDEQEEPFGPYSSDEDDDYDYYSSGYDTECSDYGWESFHLP